MRDWIKTVMDRWAEEPEREFDIDDYTDSNTDYLDSNTNYSDSKTDYSDSETDYSDSETETEIITKVVLGNEEDQSDNYILEALTDDHVEACDFRRILFFGKKGIDKLFKDIVGKWFNVENIEEEDCQCIIKSTNQEIYICSDSHPELIHDFWEQYEQHHLYLSITGKGGRYLFSNKEYKDGYVFFSYKGIDKIFEYIEKYEIEHERIDISLVDVIKHEELEKLNIPDETKRHLCLDADKKITEYFRKKEDMHLTPLIKYAGKHQ